MSQISDNCENEGKHEGTAHYWVCRRCRKGEFETGCADYKPMVKENGTWKAICSADSSGDNYNVVIQSNDFTHDVMLIVDGDFRDDGQKLKYAEEIARRLNLYKGAN